MSPWLPTRRARLPKCTFHRRQRPAPLGLESLEDRCLLASGFGQVNIAADMPGLAHVTDPNLVNPWGVAYSPTGPFWFAENGRGVSDVLDGRGQPVQLFASIPSPATSSGTPTGVALNAGSGFVISENGVSGPGTFLFDSLDGTISAWNEMVDADHALLVVNNSASHAVYTGLALATDASGQSFLYAANVSHGTIDVFDQNFQPVLRPGAFQDPNLPTGLTPFNVQTIGNQLFVAYTPPQGNDGPGLGAIDVYNLDGTLARRFASGGPLDAPWGLTMAPANFGQFGGALLVGNNGDGHINAYNPASGAFLGQLNDDGGNPITLPGLWGMTFGNGAMGGNADMLFFAAGPGDGQHGLFGAIQAPQQRGADTGGSGLFNPNAPGEPADYPVPPSGGPALQNGSTQPVSVSVLLPLTESSLTLVPTLTTVSLPAPASDMPVGSGSSAAIAYNSGRPSGQTSSGDARSADTDDPSYPQAPSRDVITLNSLLNLTPAANAPDTKGSAPAAQARANADAVFASPARYADRQSDELAPNSVRPPLVVESSIEATPGTSAANDAPRIDSSGDEEEPVAARVETAEQPANQEGVGWKGRVPHVLGVVSVLAVWHGMQRWRKQKAKRVLESEVQ